MTCEEIVSLPYTDLALAFLLVIGGVPFVWAVASGLGAYLHALAEKTRPPTVIRRRFQESVNDIDDDDNRYTL